MKIRSKLMAAVAMLLVSVIMMTTASFAWFTISTAPEISTMTTQVVVNDNLEIALATNKSTAPSYGQTGTQTVWGNIVDLTATDVATAYGAVNKTLRPAKLNANTFEAPSYGNDGRIQETLQSLTITESLPYANIVDGNGKIYGYSVDIWLQSNKAGTVTLAAANTKRSTNGEAGNGSVFTSSNQTLADNIAIAVQPGAAGNITAMTAATPTGTGTYTTTFTGNVVTLQANTPQLVRIFIFLDGESVTNAAASLTGDNGIISGNLSLQFEMTGVDTSMDGVA